MTHATVNAPTIHMQLRTHLQETCNWNSTYKRLAIEIAPTRQMQWELHLHNKAIRIAPTTSKYTCTRLVMQLWTKPTNQMQLGTHPLIIECVVPFCQFMFYIDTSYELCFKGYLVAGVKVTLINSNISRNHETNGCAISVNMFTRKRVTMFTSQLEYMATAKCWLCLRHRKES